ncbi:MAG: DUF721 domain-containing protein [Syntrophales bacterium]|jgi:hypothetical protein|nr:DUF721 domain-containing protein [Syntrophales bacterium]MCK9527272.1 DUF721 domain-containing protein [Syntrophales bacterium]MDX9921258.1 DUF721 domain-containing protein [Syntrophales bacterium]
MSARRRSKKKVYRLERLGEFLPGTLVKEKIFIPTMPPGTASLWNRAVGPQIARQTEPLRLRGSVLYVTVSTPAWMQQLQYMNEEILEKVNSLEPAHRITKIRYSIGHVTPRAERPESFRDTLLDESRLKDRDRRLIAQHLSSIGDEDLREAIRRVMIREALTRYLRS